ncbi:uncharacterized protein RJT20DRAFT_123879 [Scheffersomyces xylosifermentans]|uniref:uncharacterized protein n=1 Tax=Scheffersomyces xylosifermentans TaxID=1304137 RepID=UPI00315CE0E8
MSVVQEFETIIKELPTLKAPGVSGTRIKKLTDLALKNVDQESNLITILYSNCKAAPSSHKLGTLYVVDSIVRGYTEEAKKQNQKIDASAPEGTPASAVFKISELIESLIDDALELSISTSQNLKISKLVDIWARAETFSPEIISRIRQKHFTSTTPPGSPPKSSVEPVKPAAENKDSKDSTSILSALASLAKTSSPGSSNPQTVSGDNKANTILSQLSALSGNANPSNNVPPQPQPQHSNYGAPAPQAQGNEQLIFNMLQQMQNGGGPVPQGGLPQGGLPQGGFPQGGSIPPVPQQQRQSNYASDRRGRDNYDNNGYSRRNRSRSPQGNMYGRTRSPPRHQQHQPEPQYDSPMGGNLNMPGNPYYRPRNVGFDQSLPQGSFKVLSRTLFIGGVPRNMDDRALADVLRPYAEVQSVILNSERKHAFVKVYSRREAEQVITSFNKDNMMGLRTRWGVGFGPRDCCNYQHGVSIIPIQRLTDADKSWVVNAQWGGTGGQPLSSGMVIDEPDIEIGAGISSKAMSKKMPTNSARNGPKSNRPGEPDEEYVKTTLIPQQAGNMSHGAQPDFNTFSQSSINPLSGLFSNTSPPQQHQQPGGYAQGGPPPQAGGAGFPNFLNNLQQQQQGGNPNLSATLANLFPQQGRQ